MKAIDCSIPHCKILELDPYLDSRGDFVKLFSDRQIPLYDGFRIREIFFSHSKKNVIRGMHLQTPPFDHNKVILCLAGAAFDVLVDLRKGSPAYGKPFGIKLAARQYQALYVPRGVAHGFCALEDNTTVSYFVDSAHSPEHDVGVHWRSIPVDWPVSEPIVSKRDESFPTLERFVSPFEFSGQNSVRS